jgi:hypothetical protein
MDGALGIATDFAGTNFLFQLLSETSDLARLTKAGGQA